MNHLAHVEVLPPKSKERNIFVAFAFAGNDLLLETDPEGRIHYFAGSAQRVLGTMHVGDVGDSLQELLVQGDQFMVHEIFYRLTRFSRADRVVARLRHATSGTAHARLSGIAVPDLPGRFYFALTRVAAPLPAGMMARGVTAMPDYLEQEDFLALADQRLAEAAQIGEPLQMTLIDMDTREFALVATQAQGETFRANIGGFLKAWSADGCSVTQVEENRFALLHRAGEKPESWSGRVRDIARKVEPLADVDCAAKTLDMDIANTPPVKRRNVLSVLLTAFARTGRKAFSVPPLRRLITGVLDPGPERAGALVW